MSSMVLKKTGYTLIEMIVAMSVMLIMTFGTTQIIRDTLKTKNTTEFWKSKSDLRSEIGAFLGNDLHCGCSMANLVLPSDQAVLEDPAVTPPINISATGLFENTTPGVCDSLVKRQLIRTGQNYDRIQVSQIFVRDFRLVDPNAVFANLSVIIVGPSEVYGPNIRTETIPFLLRVEQAGARLSVVGCGTEMDPIPPIPDEGIVRMLRRGVPRVERFTLPSGKPIRGNFVALMKFNFRWGENFFFDQLYLDGRPGIIDSWAYSTGADGHIRHGTLMAMVPLTNGQIRYRFDCNSRGCTGRDGSSMTLMALFPPPN